MSHFDSLFLGVCLLHPVFLTDVLRDITGVISTYSGDSALSNRQTSLPRLTTCVFSKAENWERFYDPPRISNDLE